MAYNKCSVGDFGKEMLPYESEPHPPLPTAPPPQINKMQQTKEKCVYHKYIGLIPCETFVQVPQIIGI